MTVSRKRSDRKCPAPGIGFSIGEDRLVMSVEEKYADLDSVQLLSLRWAKQPYRHAALLARDIRATGRNRRNRAEGKLKKSLELANKIGAQQTLIVGDNEIAVGTYALKNMTSGEQTSVSREDLLNRS